MIGYIPNIEDEPLFFTLDLDDKSMFTSDSVDKLASTAAISSWDITFKEVADKIAEATDKLIATITYKEEEEPLITFKNDDTIKTAIGKASIDSEMIRSPLKRPP